ncbi:Uncharacterised protein [Candidatus Tiddalikarchaeum anstoanum]|nr:Uncharacterised protein [Candidatus Tiddalikarchaeum anstoanum]
MPLCILIIATLGIHSALAIMLILSYKMWVFFFATRYLRFRSVLDLAIISQILYVFRGVFYSFNLDVIVIILDIAICVIVNYFVFLLYFTVRSGLLQIGEK